MADKKKRVKPAPPDTDALDTGRPVIDDRHERFLHEYVAADGDAVAAYRRVYTKVTSDTVARVNASRLLRDANIRRRLRVLRHRYNERNQLDAPAFLRELRLIALADPADVFDFDAADRTDGFVTLRSPRTVRPHARRAIRSIRSTPVLVHGRVRYKVEVRFHDKTAALTTLLRAAGLFRDLGDVETILASLPPKLAADIRRHLAGEGEADRPAARDRDPPEWLTRLKWDPVLPFRLLGLTPDPWQAEFLATAHPRKALLCCRRAGKTMTSAAATFRHCLTTPEATALIFSPTEKQSKEYARYVKRFDKWAGHPVTVVRNNEREVEWANGSRLICMPDQPDSAVGFTPTKLVIDEGSRVSDQLYLSIRPMLALGGALEVLSTPFGRRGWFFQIFDTPERLRLFESWRITAAMCPRISPRFLAEERAELGERWFRQEYDLAFNDAVDAVFGDEHIRAAVTRTTLGPLFPIG
jgi:hypothetical protein